MLVKCCQCENGVVEHESPPEEEEYEGNGCCSDCATILQYKIVNGKVVEIKPRPLVTDKATRKMPGVKRLIRTLKSATGKENKVSVIPISDGYSVCVYTPDSNHPAGVDYCAEVKIGKDSMGDYSYHSKIAESISYVMGKYRGLVKAKEYSNAHNPHLFIP